MNAPTIIEFLRNRVDAVHQLIQQQKLGEARQACCELIADARILQQLLRLKENDHA